MSKKVLILKNDRTGDLFVSLNTINKIINKHSNQEINIFLSNINHKFSFLFPKIKKKIFSMNLSILEKVRIIIFILFNNIESIYILSPKNFYFYLPFIFRKIKFYAITIKSDRSRPNNFLKRYLFKYIEINRVNIVKRRSSYLMQAELIETTNNSKNFLSMSKNNYKYIFKYPNNYVYFHYKHNLFNKLLKWDLEKIISLINFLEKKYSFVIFSSELNNQSINKFFSERFNTYDFISKNKNLINNKKVIFLKDVDGYDLFNAVKLSNIVICPEGIISHMGYYLKKKTIALLHFNLKNRQDFINQVISCKEWFPPNNYLYLVLKKNFDKSILKLKKRNFI